ncbi:MAG: TMEM165/GDT1 family protein [Nevskiaceae bacterium]|nr:TMEM165/GDT1 family protein [Nevskiaceae bacterium]
MIALLHALAVSTGVVALAEIGDKTQLLAFVLAARFRRPWPIIIGIFAATILNHALAGALGGWISAVVSPQVMRWILGLGFLAMAVWILIPDKIDDDETNVAQRYGVFGTTFVAFFLAEMGDKTQIATVGLAAHYASTVAVVAGTTLGMLIANVPAVIIGDRLAGRIPMKLMHGIAAVLFAALGIATLTGLGARFGF